MSTPPPPPPPGQPYQNPQPGAGAAPPPGQIPGQPPTGGGYGAPVPQQHNPYAQTSPGFGLPQQQPGYYGAPPQGVPPQQPPGTAPRGTGGAGRGLVWAVVGAAVASAAWAGGVFLLGDSGSGSAKPDLHGYKVVKDLCKTADLSAFDTQYPKKDDDPTAYTSDRTSVAQMYCSESPDTDDDSSGYSYAYLTVNAQLHRTTDPKAEFGDNWRAYGDRGLDPDDNYKVTAVDGFGDEAYLLSRDTVEEGSSGSREVILAVRDGGLTFSLSWDAYTSSSLSDDSDTTDTMPSLDEATAWVKKSATATMSNLK
jgi:hypothetical protein